jgi:hypothetical protein
MRTLLLLRARSSIWYFACMLNFILAICGLIGPCTYRERAIEFMPPGQDSLVIIVDYKSATLRTNPSIGTARKAR